MLWQAISLLFKSRLSYLTLGTALGGISISYTNTNTNKNTISEACSFSVEMLTLSSDANLLCPQLLMGMYDFITNLVNYENYEFMNLDYGIGCENLNYELLQFICDYTVFVCKLACHVVKILFLRFPISLMLIFPQINS